MRKRTAYTLLTVLLLLCALAAALYLRQKAPPEAARLLPESDAIVFVNLRPLRAATHFDRNPISPASFQPFIDATGILPERDLDAVAIGLHRMPDPSGPNGPTAFSLVMEGRFDRTRLTRYLESISARQETYAGRIIYCIPSQGRTVRVALLGYDTIATSNTPTPEQIHSILDRQRAAASPFAGSSLLAARYADVPAFSAAWAIGHIGLPFTQNPAGSEGSGSSARITLMGLELPLPADTTFVASLGLSTSLPLHPGAVALRIDQIAPSDADAAQSVSSLNGLLSLFRSIQSAQQPTPRTPADLAFRQFIDSIAIVQHHDRATLTATLPPDTLKRLTTP